ncbi:MAG: FtsX-like permease family protein, partial [Lachnospiraceae bacterium]|nr:FtsX-like permease family protein [Lachnospiraceae bacterium]
SVFCGPDTIRTLITAAKERKMFDFGNLDPNKIVSCIMVDTADGYSVDEVMNEINLHVRKVRAIRTAEMIANVSDQLEGTSSIATALTVAVWILSLIILSLAYTMMTRERRKEFALLRVMGASGKMLSGILLIESFLLSAVGSVMGAILAVGMSEGFSALIEESMKMPFLLPEGFRLIALVLGTTLLSIGAGALSSAFSAAKMSKIDAALTLRSE